MATVVVVFWSRMGSTERLALAAAVGAVQARANIRLRWLREDVDETSIDAVPGWRENRERMLQEYIAPRDIDIEGADGLVLLSPSHVGPDAVEWKSFFELVERVASSKPKPAACGHSEFHQRMTGARLSLVPESPEDAGPDLPERSRLLGRCVAQACR